MAHGGTSTVLPLCLDAPFHVAQSNDDEKEKGTLLSHFDGIVEFNNN